MAKRNRDDFSLEAERRYYREWPQEARDYRFLRAYLACLPDACSLLAGRDVLDIGAGECLYSAFIAEFYASRVVALELIPERMRPAALAFRLPNLYFVAGDCHRLPFPDASFDCVFGDLILHHFPVPGAIVAEVRRVLRPGGAYLGIEPNFANPAVRLHFRLVATSDNERAHSPERLQRALEQNGFQVTLRYFWRRFPGLHHRFLTTCVGLVARS